MATRVADLQCWRLADELRTEVHAICAQPQVTERRRFCDGFTEAAGSVCRNISEGCQTRKFILPERCTTLLELAEHTRATTLNFKRYHERKQREKRKAPRRTRP